MRFLLSNDDGIDAPGLTALRKAVEKLGDCTLIAPHEELSGCSHQVNTHREIRVHRRDEDAFAVEGTPADCVRLGLFSLHPETDWVLAGINNGGNLGVDFHHSGTVSAVREAVINGKPGIAVSHFHHRGVLLDWERASSLVAPIIRQILSLPVKKGIMWNINLPNLDPKSSDPEVVHCPLDTNPLPLEFFNDGNFFRYNGNYWGRKRDPGSDVDVCFGGKISVTCVNLFSISIGCD